MRRVHELNIYSAVVVFLVAIEWACGMSATIPSVVN